jgi:ubiquinone/menaquinone biosynthesis C-methylase UbiE
LFSRNAEGVRGRRAMRSPDAKPAHAFGVTVKQWPNHRRHHILSDERNTLSQKENNAMSDQKPNPRQQLLQMIHSYWTAQAIHVAAKLKLADLVKDEPKTAEELAKASKTHPPSLYRLMRALASVGIFCEGADGRFSMTSIAECLLDRPGSQYAVALTMGDEHYRAWGDLLYSIQTGKPAFDHLYGKPIFDYLSENAEPAKIFDAAMTGFHGPETQAMIDAYDYAGINTLIDVGGGNGTVLSAVLKKNPAMKGILYDLPGVIERAKQNLADQGLASRCQTIAGSFFESAPPGGDAYQMRHIIHDWTDEQCRTILSHIRKVMPKLGRLLVIEMVIKPGNEPQPAKWLDLNMLVLPGGRERTEAEYREMFAKAGFRLERIVPTPTEVSVIEGKPV